MEKIKIQISEEQASDMISRINVPLKTWDIIQEWKESGYIKKSALDEARKIADHGIASWGGDIMRDYIRIKNAYEEAITEKDEIIDGLKKDIRGY